ALAAVGISIVYGILRLVNFAYGDYMTFGAFMGILFNVTLKLPIIPAALLAMVATAALSVALELVLWRPLRARSAGFMSLFLASVSGVRTNRVIVFTWILSGLLAGLAGVLAGLVQTAFDPNLGFTILLPIFAAVVLGGIGSAYGALVGGLALGLAMELSTWSSLAGGVDPTYKPVVAFGLLV